MNRRVLLIIGIVAVIGGHLVAVIQYRVTADAFVREAAFLPPPDITEQPIPPRLQVAAQLMRRWTVQFTALVAVSLAIALAAVTARTQGVRALLFACQGATFLISTYADGLWMFAQLTLLVTLIVLAHLLFAPRPATALAALAVVAYAALPRAANVWGNVLMVQTPDRIIGAISYAVGAVVTAHLLHATTHALDAEQRLSQRLNQSVLQLTSANVGFQDYATTAEERSSQEERNRITREVHDSIGYSLTNIVVMMEAAQGLIQVDPERLRQTLVLARTQAQDALAEVRRTLRALRAASTPRRSARMLLEKLFRTFESATNVSVRVEYRNLFTAPESAIDSVIYRTVQEGLTNAFRHGRATEVMVLFWFDGNGISVSLRDNGVGSQEIKDGIGLRGMRERIEPLGGTVHAGCMDGAGFELRVWVPVKRGDVGTTQYQDQTAAG